MDLPPTTGEEIAAACAELRARGPFPAAIARGLEGDDPDEMRAAVAHLIEGNRTEGLRALVERFRAKRDFGVWARVTSSQLHRAAGDYGAALADIDDLMARFPQRASAHWWVARARALEGLGRPDDAAGAVRDAIARFPGSELPRPFLANLLSRQKRPAEALEVWREAHARFPHADLAWFVGLANALKALGRAQEARDAIQEGARRFPEDRRTPPLLAEAAEERRQWARALEIWDDFFARFPNPPDANAEIGRARALFRLDRVEEAVRRLEDFLARDPDCVAALRERGAMAMELGETARAVEIFARLTRDFADASRPEWWASLARARHDGGDEAAGAQALAELERRFPASALADGERLRFAKEREHGLDHLHNLVAAARQRFPHDFNLRSHWVWLLLSLGRLAEAEREVEALEAEAAPGFALAARLRLEADRGDETLRACVTRLAGGRDWSLPDALQVAYALLDVRAPWAFALGDEIVDALAETFAGSVRLTHLRIRLKIARRDDAAALALVDAIPARYQKREFLELRAWAAAKRGRDAEAQSLWRTALATHYYAAVHSPIDALARLSPDDRPGPDAGVTAYVVFRNEAAQMPGFLAHHRRLGVKRFVFFDHRSDDASREMALREPDVIVYDCPDSYQLSWSGRRWVNEIVAREGARGWGLQLDMDEHLLYPGCETTPIDRFVAYLDAQGFEGVRGYMLDVFPRRLLDERGAPTPPAEYRWCDDDYTLFGMERPPYLQPGGGVRARLFEAKEFLHKTPLWRLEAGVLINSHETTHLKFADVSAALLHYKLMNVALRGRGAAGADAGAAFLETDADVEAIRRHSRYAARLARLWRADLVKPGVSREWTDSLTLAQRGLMDVSDAYRDWLGRG